MLFSAGIEAALEARNQPVITLFDLHLLVQSLVAAGHWQGKSLTRVPLKWRSAGLPPIVSRLLARETLRADRDFGGGVYRVMEIEPAGTAAEVACIVDPFCYISHASAMKVHELTSTGSQTLHLSTPEGRMWRAKQSELASQIQPDANGMRSTYARPHFGERLRKQKLLLRETITPSDVAELGTVSSSCVNCGRPRPAQTSQPFTPTASVIELQAGPSL